MSDDTTMALRLEMHGIRKVFGPTIALGGVDLAVRPGEVHALIGENGAGKSTLMKTLSGAHQPTDGAMLLDGQAYAPQNPREARDRGVAMIYQELSLAQHLSICENIFLGCEPKKGLLLDWATMRSRTAEVLERVGLSHLSPDATVGNLSNAQQQLIEIARSLIFDCKVLVLDEPTSSLTASDIDKLFDLIRDLKGQGISIVFISHFLEEVRTVCDAYSVLRDGNSVGSGFVKDVTDPEIITLMVGRDVDDLYPRTERTQGEVVLALNKLAGVSGKPREATFELHRGEVLGIAGLVGAGRTETMRAIFGLDHIASGTIKVGTVEGPVSPAKRWKSGVGMLSEDRKREGLALGLSIADNLTLSKLEGLGPGPFVTPSGQAKACEPWIAKIPIKCQGPMAPMSSLSGGNQQKVALARLLHADVDVLLLDEPTRGIDVGSKAQIYALIDELARSGKAILMISSYLPELMGTCDRIAVMSKGVLHPARNVADVTEHDIMVEATTVV
ncbi:MAG: sugar ABC transporter ATP-binding protein [Planctomycetota bacterium]|jgi:ribose transport system ATP-binding protein